jgi:hypothetical protein
MKHKNVLSNAVVFLIIPVLITVAQYYANLSMMPLFLSQRILVSPSELLLYEGILFIIVGFLTLLGIRGAGSEEAVGVAATANAVFSDDEMVKPSRIFRDYIWNPKGYPRLALVLMIAGVLMIFTHFFTY